MNLDALLKETENKFSAIVEDRAIARDLVTEFRTKADIDRELVSDSEAAAAVERFKSLDTQADALKTRVEELRAEVAKDRAFSALGKSIIPAADSPADTGQIDRAPVVVQAEPRTYSAHSSAMGERSFFVDAYRSTYRHDIGARDRIDRHLKEAAVERELTARQQESRAVASGDIAGLAIPAYLPDMAVNVLRNGRPTANAIRKMQLPAQGMTINVQRATTGATAAVQATQNTNVSRTDQVWGDIAVPVITIAGQQQVSRQSLERGTPGLDQIMYADLVGAYAAAQDSQILNGTGAAGQMLGLTKTAGISTTSVYGAAVTFATFNTKIAGMVATMAGSGTAIRPRLFVMHPRRWGWLNSLLDTTNRPLTLANNGAAQNAIALLAAGGAYSGDSGINNLPEVVGTLSYDLPVITDANIATAVGTGPEDQVLLIDPQAHLLFQDGDGMPRELSFEQAPVTGQVNGTALSTTLVVYGYSAFTAGRYPTATGLMGGSETVAGNGLIAPTF